jgi:hypothetical protein
VDRRDEQGSYKRTLNRRASPHRRKAPTSHPFTSAFAIPRPGSGGAGMPAKGKGDLETNRHELRDTNTGHTTIDKGRKGK